MLLSSSCRWFGVASGWCSEDAKPARIGFVEPEKDEDAAAVEERWKPDPKRWHPALGFAELPHVPQTMGARIGTDGNVEILQPAKWNSFRAYCRGCCDSTTWLVKGMLQIGPYPIGQADHDQDEVTAHSSMAAQLLLAGHNVYVNCMMQREWESVGATHEDDLVYKAQELRTNARRAMEGAKSFYKREATKYKNSVKYSKEKRRQLKEKALEAKKKYEEMKQKYTDFPAQLHFINFPIPNEYVVADDLVEAVCREIESRLRSGDVRLWLLSLLLLLTFAVVSHSACVRVCVRVLSCPLFRRCTFFRCKAVAAAPCWVAVCWAGCTAFRAKQCWTTWPAPAPTASTTSCRRHAPKSGCQPSKTKSASSS